MAGDLWDAANAQIAVKYDPQQAALQRQLELSGKNTAANEAALNQYGTTGRNIIGETYNTLYGLLGANKTDTANALNQQLDLTNRGYDQAISNIQNWQQSSRDYIAKMAAELGQSGQGLVSSAGLENSVNQQLGYANAARTNYGSTLGDWISKMGSIQQMGIDSAHQAEALRKSSFETELLRALSANKLAGTNQETDVINKIADLMNVKQSDLVAMYNQLAAQQWEREFKQAQLNQQAQEASADLAYKYASLRQSAAEGAANRSASQSSDLMKFLYGAMQDAADREWDEKTFAANEAYRWRSQGEDPGMSLSDINAYSNFGMLPGMEFDEEQGKYIVGDPGLVGQAVLGLQSQGPSWFSDYNDMVAEAEAARQQQIMNSINPNINWDLAPHYASGNAAGGGGGFNWNDPLAFPKLFNQGMKDWTLGFGMFS